MNHTFDDGESYGSYGSDSGEDSSSSDGTDTNGFDEEFGDSNSDNQEQPQGSGR